MCHTSFKVLETAIFLRYSKFKKYSIKNSIERRWVGKQMRLRIVPSWFWFFVEVSGLTIAMLVVISKMIVM